MNTALYHLNQLSQNITCSSFEHPLRTSFIRGWRQKSLDILAPIAALCLILGLIYKTQEIQSIARNHSSLTNNLKVLEKQQAKLENNMKHYQILPDQEIIDIYDHLDSIPLPFQDLRALSGFNNKFLNIESVVWQKNNDGTQSRLLDVKVCPQKGVTADVFEKETHNILKDLKDYAQIKNIETDQKMVLLGHEKTPFVNTCLFLQIFPYHKGKQG